MPWKPADAARHNKALANEPKLQRQWSEVANSVLAKTGNEGQAVREANSAVKKRK